MNKGWICPNCGRIWSPEVKECTECNKFVPYDDFTKRPVSPVYACPIH